MQPLPLRNARQLGVAVRAARESEGLTQAELARRAGLERQWVVLFENGKVDNPTFGNVLSVVTAVNLQLQVAQAPTASFADLDELMG